MKKKKKKKYCYLLLLLPKPQNLKCHHLKANLLHERDDGMKLLLQIRLEKQATQLDKITIMLHSIQKDMKSTKGQSKLINQLQSQIKQLRTQMSQIQKNIAKRNFTTATISSRTKMLRPNKR